ncbi:MAG: hypothetical protein ACR2IF_04660 [Terriglobales bacterium]
MASAAPSPQLETSPPPFGMLPPLAPRRGLLFSFLFHVALLIFLSLIPQMLPGPPLLSYRPLDLSLTAYEPITFGGLPAVSDGGSGGGSEGGSAGGSAGVVGGKPARPGTPKPAAKSVPAPAEPEKPATVYAGPQEIISISRNPTNTVQTIRRPDLPAPPKLKFPVRLQSMVELPAPVVPVLTAPPPVKPAEQAKAAELAIAPEPTVEHPALTVHTPQQQMSTKLPDAPKLAPAKTQAPPVLDVRNRPMPVLAPQEQGTGTKTALVVNAVAVPPDSKKDVPDAELEGSFAVLSSRRIVAENIPVAALGAAHGSPSDNAHTSGMGSVTSGAGGSTGNASGTGGAPSGTGVGPGSGGTGTGTGGGHGSGAAASGAGPGAGAGARPGSGSGTGAGPGHGSGPGKATGPGSGPGHGTGTGTGTGSGKGSGVGPGTGNGSGSGPGSANGPFPGVTIVGGSGGRGSRSAPVSASPSPRRNYEITIISGGSSGGSTRELGIFRRDETVYTVYISMADAGGGPECSMQYAVVGSAPAGDGLLAPPYAVKKFRPVLRSANPRWDSRPVFVTGIIDENGRMQNMRAVYADDSRSVPVISTLEKWEFLPAQVNGRSVAAKILIGITALPAATDKDNN